MNATITIIGSPNGEVINEFEMPVRDHLELRTAAIKLANGRYSTAREIHAVSGKSHFAVMPATAKLPMAVKNLAALLNA